MKRGKKRGKKRKKKEKGGNKGDLRVVLGGIWNEENTECRTQNTEENGEDG